MSKRTEVFLLESGTRVRIAWGDWGEPRWSEEKKDEEGRPYWSSGGNICCTYPPVWLPGILTMMLNEFEPSKPDGPV